MVHGIKQSNTKTDPMARVDGVAIIVAVAVVVITSKQQHGWETHYRTFFVHMNM